jgi:hypothetical protein
MNISATQIQNTCTGTLVLETQVTTILKTFQSAIIDAAKNGSTSVVVEVPTNFNIVSMSNKTAQTIIYHRLIEVLEKKGFNVKLGMDDASVTYCIRWDIKTDSRDLVNMRNAIASHVIRNDKPTSGK